MHTSLKTTKPYTPDISLTSEQGLSRDLYKEVSALDGVKTVSGRMFGYAEATFDASRLTAAYKESVGGISETKDGLFAPLKNPGLSLMTKTSSVGLNQI
jgi:putative ABC transport system permease protein